MELIDRDKLIEFIKERQASTHDRLTYEEFIDILESRETVNAVPIVNCRDCACYDAENHYCNSANVDMSVWFWETDNHFCFNYKPKGDTDITSFSNPPRHGVARCKDCKLNKWEYCKSIRPSKIGYNHCTRFEPVTPEIAYAADTPIRPEVSD